MCRILIINDHRYPLGGADRISNEMLQFFQKKGYITKFFSYDDVDVEYYDKVWSNVLKNLFNIRVYCLLRGLIREYQPDVIFVHSWTKKLSPSCFLASRGFNVNIVAHDYFLMCPNGGQYNYRKKVKCNLKGGSLSCAFENCDKNSYLQKLYRLIRFSLQALVLGVVRPHVVCLNRMQVDMLFASKFQTTYRPNDVSYIEARFGSTVGKNILYIGRPDPEKGLDRIIDLASNVDYSFDLVGVDRNDLDDGIDEKVTFFGWCNPEQIQQRMDAARLLIFPSRWLEVDPLVPLEACSFGVPVYCSGDNLFAETLRAYGLDRFIFHNEEELVSNLGKIYKESGIAKTRKVFFRLFLDERRRRAELNTLQSPVCL